MSAIVWRAEPLSKFTPEGESQQPIYIIVDNHYHCMYARIEVCYTFFRHNGSMRRIENGALNDPRAQSDRSIYGAPHCNNAHKRCAVAFATEDTLFQTLISLYNMIIFEYLNICRAT